MGCEFVPFIYEDRKISEQCIIAVSEFIDRNLNVKQIHDEYLRAYLRRVTTEYIEIRLAVRQIQ